MTDHKLTPEEWVRANAEFAVDGQRAEFLAVESVKVLAELKRLTERAEKVERAAASMRAWMEAHVDCVVTDHHRDDCEEAEVGGCDECRLADSYNAALASDAGKGLLSREEAEEVARRVKFTCDISGVFPGQVIGIDRVIDEVIKERDRGP